MDARRQKRLGPAPIASFEKSFEDNTTTTAATTGATATPAAAQQQPAEQQQQQQRVTVSTMCVCACVVYILFTNRGLNSLGQT